MPPSVRGARKDTRVWTLAGAAPSMAQLVEPSRSYGHDVLKRVSYVSNPALEAEFWPLSAL